MSEHEYYHYLSAGHVEGKAAIQIRQAGSSGGTIRHNNPFGTCVYCLHQVPTLMPAGLALTIVPPADARPRSAWAVGDPVTLIGTVDEPIQGQVGHDSRTRDPEFQPHSSPQSVALFDLFGYHSVEPGEQLAAVLRHRSNGANHFEISADPPSYPLLTVMVNGPLAALHHFAGPGDPGAQSMSSRSAGPAVAAFPDPMGGSVTLPGDVVVDLDTAWQCIEWFVGAGTPPELEWRSLQGSPAG